MRPRKIFRSRDGVVHYTDGQYEINSHMLCEFEFNHTLYQPQDLEPTTGALTCFVCITQKDRLGAL